MWSFYKRVGWASLSLFFGAFNDVTSLSAFALFAVILFNKAFGEYAVNAWNGISPWWSAAPIALLFAYRLLQANYEKFVAMQRERDDANLKLASQGKVRPFVTPREYRDGIFIVNPEYPAYDVTIPAVPVGDTGYTLEFKGRLASLLIQDQDQFLESRLNHSSYPAEQGHFLAGLMRDAGLETVDFEIHYKDGYETHFVTPCSLGRDDHSAYGLTVRHFQQRKL